MELRDDSPVYPMGIAAELLEVHPRTLRIYEEEGLICPKRTGGKRFFSQNDIIWIKCLRSLIHEQNISIPSIKLLLQYAPCYKLKNCPEEVYTKCTHLQNNKKHCWELAQNTCDKSCNSCLVFLKDQRKNSTED